MGLPAQNPTKGLGEGAGPTPLRYGVPTQKQLDQTLRGMGNKAYVPPKPRTTKAPGAQQRPPRVPSGNPYRPRNTATSGSR